MHKLVTLGAFSALLGVNSLYAQNISVALHTLDDQAKSVGHVVFSETPYGILVTPHLKGLPSGLHGFHLHQYANCGNKGQKAGAHYDPEHTHSHKGPYAGRHLGDLPGLYVSKEGEALTPTLAPRLKLTDIKNLALMVHAGGDDYSDSPPQGGGGNREACGVIKP